MTISFPRWLIPGDGTALPGRVLAMGLAMGLALAGCDDEPERFLVQPAQRGPIEATVSAIIRSRRLGRPVIRVGHRGRSMTTLVALTTATARTPGSRPRSSTASAEIRETTR